MKVSWNLFGEEDSGEDGGVANRGVVDLSVVVAVVFFAEELMFEGVNKGDVDTSSWFELVEVMCCVGVGSEEGCKLQFVFEGRIQEDIGSCFSDRTLIPHTRVGVCSC